MCDHLSQNKYVWTLGWMMIIIKKYILFYTTRPNQDWKRICDVVHICVIIMNNAFVFQPFSETRTACQSSIWTTQKLIHWKPPKLLTLIRRQYAVEVFPSSHRPGSGPTQPPQLADEGGLFPKAGLLSARGESCFDEARPGDGH